jgi:hypothetical protein
MRQYFWMAAILTLAACSPPPTATTTTTTTTTTTVPVAPLPPAPVFASGPPSPGNCGTPDMPQACPPMPRVPLQFYPANR